ncbi:kinesin-domain-containing protein, partial [Rhizoclosmatium globosum]
PVAVAAPAAEEFTVHTTNIATATTTTSTTTAKRKAAPSPTLEQTPALKTKQPASSSTASTTRQKAVPKTASSVSSATTTTLAQELPTRASALPPKPHSTSASATSAASNEPPAKKKRAAWDKLVEFKMSLESQFQMKQVENGEMAGKLRSVQQELEESKKAHEKEVASLKQKHAEELEDAAKRESKLKLELSNLTSDHERVCNENNALKNSLSSQATTLLTIESDVRASKIKIESLESQLASQRDEIAALTEKLAHSDARVVELEAKLREEESVRRKLHNTIQGNIRVFCRIRPPLESEASQDSLSHIKFSDADDKSLELVQQSETASGQNTIVNFPPSTQQSEIFSEISQLVQSALDGYNVCIFAYGRPGPERPSPETMGMIPLCGKLKGKGWTYQFESQFLEIYNENVRDLLGAVGNVAGKHEIKHVGVRLLLRIVLLLTFLGWLVPVTSGKEAQMNRAVAATNSNEHSSRSHSVFTLRLTGTNSLTEESCEGVLNLIDLAGSERLSISGSTGDRLKETQAINKSLSSLGDDAHVPYRNSKLTYLLQNSLGGNSKTLMFVNVSPMAASLQESLCSLRFATKVNSCQIGTAKAVKK